MAKCKAINRSKSKCSYNAIISGLCMRHFFRDEYKNIIKNKKVE